MRQISAAQLNTLLEEHRAPVVIDIREEYEYTWSNICPINIPLSRIMERLDEIPRDKDVVIHCNTGNRSTAAIDFLTSQCGFDNLINLEGGQDAWAKQIDPSKTPY
ncbi:MAG: rhodanese-like domain-containing protein [Flavobacteriales bacterium]|jgi:adenylyltransferase/sulfurtransferase|nr:rhodanese-like domain-containing protein [Flavobacteriales bacterium]